MKIAEVRATPANTPFRATCVFSYGSIASLTKTVIELVTDAGIAELGAVADGDRPAAVLAMGERPKGLDVRAINPAERRCVAGMRSTPWGDMVGQRRAFGGIEMATSPPSWSTCASRA
jgi:L-alanine-DL-glutamate epimerase-like enolase superfamily enzyme